jgi:transketolase
MGAAERLQAKGITASVYNAHSLKPFDEEGLLSAVRDARLVATVEDHSVIGGLGSCVAEALARHGARAPLEKYGVQDVFGESGEAAELFDKFGISADRVAERISARLRQA